MPSSVTNLYRNMLIVAASMMSVNSFANEDIAEVSVNQSVVDQIVENDKVNEPDFSEQDVMNNEDNAQATDINTETTLPSEESQSVQLPDRMSKAETLKYLKKNPQELEFVFAKLIRIRDIEGISDLLPIYQKYENRDQSLVEWGEAVLAESRGDIKKAISIFRKLNAEFPNVRMLRFQMALSLLNDKQYNAAKSELEKLRSVDDVPESDLKVINNLISSIDRRDEWSFYTNFTYLDDDNLTNSPEQGTDYGNGFVAGARESGKGVGFSLSADKRWLYDNKLFTSFNAGTYGNYYWDNKNYSTISATGGVGVGYQGDGKEFELAPYYTKQYYGGGSSGNEKLHDYLNTVGVRLSSNFVLDNRWKYSNSLGYSQNKYVESGSSSDSDDFTLGHTLVYNMNPLTYLYGGVDYFNRDSKLDYNSFIRKGVRLGWGQTWPKGFATRANIGYAKRDYQGIDIIGDKRKNDEYNAGVSFWNRGLHVFGLTPKVNWKYKKVDSNSAREEVESNDVSFNLTKSF